MSTGKIPDYAELAVVAAGDLQEIVDISDLTMSAAGTTKKITRANYIGANLSDIAGLANTDGNFIVGNSTNFVAESGATARASLGLTIGTNVQAWDADLDTLATAFTTASSTTAAKLAFAEDTDNGSNTVSIIGATSSTANFVQTLQAATGTVLVTGGIDVPVADGGTGASNSSDARSNLGIPGSTTDNSIIRANGTAGQTQGSKIIISDLDEISAFNGNVVAKTSTAITLATADTGTIITTTSTKAASIITLPNSLITGFNCSIIQNSTAAISFTAGSGATLNNRQSHTKIAGRFGVSTVLVTSNSTGSTAAVFVLGGDTST